MFPADSKNRIRQKVQQLKELPLLPVIAQKILAAHEEEVNIGKLAALIEQDPILTARILGLANSAYFGWSGKVHTIYDAIYKVLGLKTVKSFALGLALGQSLKSSRCPGFRCEQYWFIAVATASMMQKLVIHLEQQEPIDTDTVYIDGLLHNLGIPVMVFSFPDEMSDLFTMTSSPEISLSGLMQERFGMDHHQAGGWLARKWHLPDDVVCVIENHHNRNYRGCYWKIALLTGYCSRFAETLFQKQDLTIDEQLLSDLGIPVSQVEELSISMAGQWNELNEMAEIISKG